MTLSGSLPDSLVTTQISYDSTVITGGNLINRRYYTDNDKFYVIYKYANPAGGGTAASVLKVAFTSSSLSYV